MTQPGRARRSSLLRNVAVVVLLLAGGGYLFIRSLAGTRAEPYTVSRTHLGPWTLVGDPQASGEGALVALAPPPELAMRLFRQVFTRAGESLSTPQAPGLALVLADELLPTPVPVDELLALAREAGLERARLTPRCMGYRRVSQPGATRQLYFVWFDLPEFAAFRQALVDRLGPAGQAGFRATALSPVLKLAGAPDTLGWGAIAVDEATDCTAPVRAD